MYFLFALIEKADSAKYKKGQTLRVPTISWEEIMAKKAAKKATKKAAKKGGAKKATKKAAKKATKKAAKKK